MKSSLRIVSPYLQELAVATVLADAGARASAFKAHNLNRTPFFVKAFNKPKIIKGLLDENIRREKIELCRIFEKKQHALYMRASEAQEDCHELARFFDFFNCEGVYYAVYEYVEQVGSDGLDREKQPTQVMVLADAASGLARLHAFGILHGDVKPANIILYRGEDDREGRVGQPALRGKLIDYDGGCHLSDIPPVGARLLDFDEVYAAPEFQRFLAEDRSVKMDTSMDVFAFAMTAAHVLTGDMPMEAVKSLVDGAEPQALLKLKGLPPAIAEIIVRGVAIDPAQRPKALDLASALSNWLGRRHVASKSRQRTGVAWYDPLLAPRPRRTETQYAEKPVVTPRKTPTPTTTGPYSSLPGTRKRSARVPRLEDMDGDPAPVRRLTDD